MPAGDRRTAVRPLRHPRRRVNPLPFYATRLVGRARDTDVVVARIRDGVRLLTLTGPGGVGKTRVAVAAASALEDYFADGVYFVDLSVMRDVAFVLPAVARVIGARESRRQPLLDAVIRSLGLKHVLLVLDNFEHVIQAARDISALLPSCPNVTVLTTSREPLHLIAEYQVPVLPLELPESDVSGAASVSPAVVLFVSRARMVAPNFIVDDSNIGVIVEICRRLDGLPLALELAAARLKVISVQALLARLTSRLTVLTGGTRDQPARLQALRETIGWSYELLTYRERVLFSQLSVFAGRWPLEAAEAVCDANHDLPSGLFEGITSLVDKNLVRSSQGTQAEPRFSMLETIREYAAHQLDASGDAEAVRDRHASWFLDLSEWLCPRLHGLEPGPALNQVESEYDNFRVALDWLLKRGDHHRALRLAVALRQYWSLRGQPSEGLRWLVSGITQSAGLPAPLEAAAKLATGHLKQTGGNYEEAIQHYTVAASIGSQLGDDRLVADAHFGAGSAATELAAYSRAQARLEQSLALYRDLGNERGEANALHVLGDVAWRKGDYAAASQLLEAALAIRERVGDRTGAARSFNNLGNLAYREGRLTEARSRYEHALEINRSLGNLRVVAHNLLNVGNVADDLGDYVAARALFEESLAIARSLGDRPGQIFPEHNLGNVEASMGRYAAAMRSYSASLAIARELGEQEAVALALMSLGIAACRLGDLESARRHLRESLELRRRLGTRWGIAESLEGFATLAVAEHQPQRAARLLGAASAFRARLPDPLAPADEAQYERDVATARSLMDRGSWVSAWAGGRAMHIDEAIAFALGDHDQDPRAESPWSPLTRREWDVVRLIIEEGASNAEIASRLVLALGTVRKHVQNSREKLGCARRTQFAAWAAARGLSPSKG
jgi:predicted ATPase/DNA-binding CsgD family transcriptional regulator/Tfp pilus assembly protein PilF